MAKRVARELQPYDESLAAVLGAELHGLVAAEVVVADRGRVNAVVDLKGRDRGRDPTPVESDPAWFEESTASSGGKVRMLVRLCLVLV